MNILQVSSFDLAGGAEKVAADLHRLYQEKGHHSYLAVGRKRARGDPSVMEIPHDKYRSSWARFCTALAHTKALSGKYSMLRRVLRKTVFWSGQPGRLRDLLLGHEDFAFPGTGHLLRLPEKRPDILHCHNLHGGYFDLGALPSLSRQVPIVLTLHDAWLLSGHCAHSFACGKWRTGCGSCPDLDIYPAIRRDATAYNHARKRDIFSSCRIHAAAPSQWLMDKAKQSLLAPAVATCRVIPNGVSLEHFHPGDKAKARSRLGIGQDTKVLLFSANGIRSNPWKDFKTMRAAVASLSQRFPQGEILFIALGEAAPEEEIGHARIRFVPFEDSPDEVARYYQAADLYIHAAREETFGITIVEALACGTPVVATAVGGIPEIVRSIKHQTAPEAEPAYGLHEATGLLVKPGLPDALAQGIETLLRDGEVLQELGRNAAQDARERFDLVKQAESHLQWYGEILQLPAHVPGNR